MKKSELKQLIRECLKEADISSHLHSKPFQVAITTDKTLPLRKWNHIGVVQAPSSKSAAYNAYNGSGDITEEFSIHPSTERSGTVYKFSTGEFIFVGL